MGRLRRSLLETRRPGVKRFLLAGIFSRATDGRVGEPCLQAAVRIGPPVGYGVRAELRGGGLRWPVFSPQRRVILQGDGSHIKNVIFVVFDFFIKQFCGI
jgi:hypothetical protein